MLGEGAGCHGRSAKIPRAGVPSGQFGNCLFTLGHDVLALQNKED